MHKQAKPLNLNLPFVRVMARKRAVEIKWGTHKGKVGRVFNVHKWNVTFFPKSHKRTPSDDLRVS